ncbi:hypothetical protein RHSIM_Rhsim09G0064100 [Rhododendron simsii]|uniref:MULE transposase domain-containing protein n=1 Tax=Rhododendron simsii TaxID=118357 RepID=A0A834LFD4_RHOSS|nr:hypothetical protein RHSIM_Rhsim09G0064100 [Rhododendron simsii]
MEEGRIKSASSCSTSRTRERGSSGISVSGTKASAFCQNESLDQPPRYGAQRHSSAESAQMEVYIMALLPCSMSSLTISNREVGITSFLSGCRPMLFIDACFLIDLYGGSCLSTVTHNANDQLFPLAYVIVSSENYEDWLWFMQNLKEIITGKQIVLVTDRNVSLLRTVMELFGEECNAWCVRHVKKNFSKFANSRGMRGNPKKTTLDLFTKIAYARDHLLYGVYLTKLFTLKPKLAKWVDENGPQHWSNALFPYPGWDKLYTNITKSFNNWILKLREMDIIQFMKGHVIITIDMLFRHKMEVTKWHPLPGGCNIDKMIKESQKKSQGFTGRVASLIEFIV